MLKDTTSRLRDPHDLAWAAGFFDGEGCVRINVYHHRDSKLPLMNLRVTVNNTDRRAIDKLHDLFPGSIQYIRPGSVKHRMQIRWDRHGNTRAYEFCKAILPFSVIKRDQLELAIAFVELPWRIHSRTSSRKHCRTDDEVVIDESYAKQLSALKKVSNISSGVGI